ncbi:unnamed protein product [Discosporangium mesarthrocarpum]
MEGSPEDPGVIPRLCAGLFEAILEKANNFVVTVAASYVEIYQENIRDLLCQVTSPTAQAARVAKSVRRGSGSSTRGSVAEDRKQQPVIRESKDGVYLENVVEEPVKNKDGVLSILARGSKKRSRAETQMNAVSSRSHAVLTLGIEQTEVGDSEGVTSLRSKLSLVDLAGSERAKSTGAEGDRLKEAANINKSLSALGNVINALTGSSSGSGAGGGHVPYRDSKLTRLLQDSLGGSAYTVVCCNISPAAINESETVSTLRFAERLKKVKNHMVIHMDEKAKTIIRLRKENAMLLARLAAADNLLAEHGLQVPVTKGNQNAN